MALTILPTWVSLSSVWNIFFQIITGPAMEIELVSPAFVVPEDIEIGVRHFLTVPSGTSSKTDHQRDTIHRVVKLTKTASGFEIEHIDTKSKVSSGYFQTKNFVGKSLCHITTTATAECIHASVKKFYVTQHQKNCPHTKFSLSLFCVCEGSDDRFHQRRQALDHKLGPVILDYDIEKDMTTNYSMDIKVQNGDWGAVDGEHFSHKKLCKFNGMLQIGQVTEAFNCSCDDDIGCHKRQSIEIRVKQVEQGNVQPKELGGQLHCGCHAATLASHNSGSPGEGRMPFWTGRRGLIEVLLFPHSKHIS